MAEKLPIGYCVLLLYLIDVFSMIYISISVSSSLEAFSRAASVLIFIEVEMGERSMKWKSFMACGEIVDLVNG